MPNLYLQPRKPGSERLGASSGPHPSSNSQSPSSILRAPQDPSSRVPQDPGRSGGRGALGGEPMGRTPAEGCLLDHRLAEVGRQVGPLRVVEDAVVSASRAAGLRHHVHHAVLTGHLGGGEFEQAGAGPGRPGPSSGWSRPRSAQLGPSAQADTREGRAKPPQGDLGQPWPCQAPPCGSNG